MDVFIAPLQRFATTCLKRFAAFRSARRGESIAERHAGIRLLPAVCGLCAMLVFTFTPVQARTAQPGAAKKPTLQLDVGFDGATRLDYWTQARITLSNDGGDFTGVLSATTYSSPSPARTTALSVLPWSYKEPVTLPHGAKKNFTLTVPFYESPQVPTGIIATLSNNAGKVIVSQTTPAYAFDPGALVIGILSDQPPQGAGFSPLTSVSLPDASRSIQATSLSANTLPTTAEELDVFDMIVLEDFSSSALNAAQFAALQTWVNRGGALIEIGGQQWQRTLHALPASLLPLTLQGTDTLAPGTALLPVGAPTLKDIGQAGPTSLSQALTISAASLPAPGDRRLQAFSSIDTVLSSGASPLIVQARQGQGLIYYLAFDPATEPLSHWAGAIALWKGLLLRALGDQTLFPNVAPRYSSGPGELVLRGGLLQTLQPGTLFPGWILVVLLLGYLVLIGPVRYIVIKRLNRPRWSWRIVLSTAVVFALLAYGFAFNQKEASINSVSLVQLNQGGQYAHITTFSSIFLPGQGDAQVHMSARVLAQPVVGSPFQRDDRIDSNSYHASFTVGQNGTDFSFPDVGGWALHPIVTEADAALPGGVFSRLSLHGNALTGTITNTLSASLSDVYVLLPRSFAYIGTLAAGQTTQVHVLAQTTTQPGGATLADRIARDSHLPTPYFPYASGDQPRNDFQRHMALLTALSGEGYDYEPCGGPCSAHALVGKHIITAPPFGGPQGIALDASDPLLIDGAQATLIGWADSSFDALGNATVNGGNARGTRDTLVQSPLNLDVSADRSTGGVFTGQLVNVQGNSARAISPALYNMNTGSITFAFTIPGALAAHAAGLTLTTPFIGQSGHAQALLYNWQRGSWDTFSPANVSLSASNAPVYLSTDGHLFMQVANFTPSNAILVFEKPSLSLSTP